MHVCDGEIGSCWRNARFSKASSVRFFSPDFSKETSKNSPSIMTGKLAL